MNLEKETEDIKTKRDTGEIDVDESIKRFILEVKKYNQRETVKNKIKTTHKAIGQTVKPLVIKFNI